MLYGGRDLKEEVAKHYASTSEKEVNVENAMTIPAVSNAVEIITSTVASLPIKLYYRDSGNEVIEVSNDPRSKLLNREPNVTSNAYNLKKQLVQDYLFYGHATIKKESFKVGNEPVSLHLLNPEEVKVIKKIKSGYVVDVKYKYENEESGQKAVFDRFNVIRILRNSRDGVTGTGILDEGKDVLQLALNEMDYSKNILKNGALPLGILEVPNIVSEKAMARLRQSFNSAFTGHNNVAKTLVLENGLKYQPLSLKPNDLDLSGSKKTTISNIARLFNIPESMINADVGKYKKNEEQNIHFLQYSLKPILTAIENALNKQYLLEAEKDRGYYFAFDTMDVLQTTHIEKIEAIKMGLEGGIYTINEARRMLNLKDITDNDFYILRMDKILIDVDSGNITMPNLGRVISPNDLSSTRLVKEDIHRLEKVLDDLDNVVATEEDLDEILEDSDGKGNIKDDEDI